MRTLVLLGCLLSLLGCGPSQSARVELTPVQLVATYVPRVGIAVRTASRTCVGIQNANLAMSSPITLVMPNVPQSFVLARIKAGSETACPIAKELDPTVSNYELNLPDGEDSVPKLTPLIAVVGDPDGFLRTNVTVQADLDHDKGARMFRSCGSSDGINLTVWSGTPVSSSLLWHGFYYDPGGVARSAPCTTRETAGLSHSIKLPDSFYAARRAMLLN